MGVVLPLILALLPLQAAAPAPVRPNLLLVVTDDQRADCLGVAGHPVLQTPELDALARAGVRFENAFVTTPICAASRASILTSLPESGHGYTFGTPPISAAHARASYPALLRAAGYRTGFVGKWGVRVAPGLREEMFDAFVALAPDPYSKVQADGSRRHLTEITVDRAIDFLGSDDGRPFCLTVSFNAPHAEDGDPQQYFWPPEEDGLYGRAEVPPPPLSDPAFFAAQPAFLRESLGRVRWGWRFDTEEKRQRMTRGYWRMITGVDRAFGRLRAALAAKGRAENTVILFVSDNGYFLGERGLAGKWLIHEVSIRVPLILFDPRRPRATKPQTRTEMALNLDLAPTMLELAGVAAPAGWQGRSLVPLLAGPVDAWRSEFFFEHRFAHPQIPQSEGIRGERWVYARYPGQDPVFEELYDLHEDPHQARNLAGDPRCAGVLADHRRRCAALAAAAAGK